MRFRRNLFVILAVLATLFAVYWLVAYNTRVENLEPTESEAESAGRDIGQGIGNGLIGCIMLPVIALLVLLAWRNDAGLNRERRHREQLEVWRRGLDGDV